MFFHGCGFTGSGEEDIIRAKVKLIYENDIVSIYVSNVEMGQGAQTALSKIVAHSLEIPLTQVRYDNPDTDSVPDSGPTVASRTVMIVGFLLEKAAKELRLTLEKQKKQSGIIDTPIVVEKEYEHPDYITWDQDTFKGDAYPAYSWGVNVIEVAVGPLTFEYEISGAWAIHDVGTAIDEIMVKGQIEGGIVQGLGYGSTEVMRTRNGELIQKNVTDYSIPTSMDVPNIESELIDNPFRFGPSGAKGAGELTLIGAAPALAAAIENACNITVNTLPVTPEDIEEKIQ